MANFEDGSYGTLAGVALIAKVLGRPLQNGVHPCGGREWSHPGWQHA